MLSKALNIFLILSVSSYLHSWPPLSNKSSLGSNVTKSQTTARPREGQRSGRWFSPSPPRRKETTRGRGSDWAELRREQLLLPLQSSQTCASLTILLGTTKCKLVKTFACGEKMTILKPFKTNQKPSCHCYCPSCCNKKWFITLPHKVPEN